LNATESRLRSSTESSVLVAATAFIASTISAIEKRARIAHQKFRRSLISSDEETPNSSLRSHNIKQRRSGMAQ
jgi:hypothetical protein